MSLEMQRQQTKQIIGDIIQNTFFQRYWRAIGSLIRRGKVASIWLSAAVVMIANLLVGWAISVLLKETQSTSPEIILNNLIWVTYTYLMIPLILSINARLLEFLSNRLLVFMEIEQQIEELKTWMTQWVGRPLLQLFFYLGYSAVIAPISFYNVYRTTHFSLGVTWVYFINFFHIGAGLYGLISLIEFLLKLRHWRLRLYLENPASSPILMQLSEELMDYHDRIKATPNSLINSQSIVNLLGSLALPLLATLIEAWPYIQNLFK